jgi:hypothetical protein
LDGPRRMAGGGVVDSMFQFWLSRGGDRTKSCQKMKRRQRAHLGSMRRKRDTMRWHGDIDRRRGDTGEGKGGDKASWADVNITGPKNEKNSCGQFSCYKWTVKI